MGTDNNVATNSIAWYILYFSIFCCVFILSIGIYIAVHIAGPVESKSLFDENPHNSTIASGTLIDWIERYAEGSAIVEILVRNEQNAVIAVRKLGGDSRYTIWVMGLRTPQTKQLDVRTDFPYQSVIISPNENYIAIATEYRIELYNLRNDAFKEFKTIYLREDDLFFGTFSELPAFIPSIAWSDDNTIEVGIFKLGLNGLQQLSSSTISVIEPAGEYLFYTVD